MSEIEIDPELEEMINERIRGTKFQSVEEYINFVLETILRDDSKNSGIPQNKAIDRDVSQHLEDLGYK